MTKKGKRERREMNKVHVGGLKWKMGQGEWRGKRREKTTERTNLFARIKYMYIVHEFSESLLYIVSHENGCEIAKS